MNPETQAKFVSGAIAFGLLIGAVMLFRYISEERARHELVAMATASTGARVDGQPIDDPAVLLRALRAATQIPAHHSGPKKAVRVELIHGARVTEVFVARDSQRAEEFWLSLPGPTWNNDPLGRRAGQLRSPELDAWLRSRGL
jgi:hypothetical protein